MDDGAENISVSLGMLRASLVQGVDTMVATSHYYADEEYPDAFLQRRTQALEALQEAMLFSPDVYPEIIPAAEVLYFPGISEAEDIAKLKIAGTNAILIEPPMLPWRDSMLDEIADLRQTQGCIPVIAHVDRFMAYLNDAKLIDRVLERKMLVQVNADYFLNPKTERAAFQNLKKRKIHVVGSDCHNLLDREPNLGSARQAARSRSMSPEFNRLTQNAAQILGLGKVLP